ncbi:MAG: hypothetical protein ACP5QU_08320 [Anaerolineae bacterium]
MVQRADAMIVNALVRQALTAASEVMGENGLNMVLRASGLERFIASLSQSLSGGEIHEHL